ncbi:MAG: TIGR00730 family Rossman fold protein [Oscillospiraceae bacterium]|nr:TIGR00730 family Rossman fold protein [Oscillospiraceae bacterium]
MRICIYGASGDRLDARYFEAARALGKELGRRGHSLVFGGGAHGLMGACAEGAASAVAEIVGIAPRFFDEPGILYAGCTRFVWTDSMRERKAAMEDAAEAFVVLPGGIGTLEEFFETLTLKQLGQHGKPIALLNTLGYFDALRVLLEQAAEGGFMSRRCLALCAFCTAPGDALDHVEAAPPLTGGLTRLEDYTK